MKKLLKGIFLILFTPLFGCSPINSVQPFDKYQANILIMHASSLRPAREIISLHLPDRKNWGQIIKPKNFPGVQIMLVRKNESPVHFTETIQTKLKCRYTPYPLTLTGFVEDEMASAFCPNGHAQIITQTPSFLIYQIKCEDNRFELGKIFNGMDALYLVKYLTNKNAVSTSEIKKMSYVIESASLIRKPQSAC